MYVATGVAMQKHAQQINDAIIAISNILIIKPRMNYHFPTGYTIHQLTS